MNYRIWKNFTWLCGMAFLFYGAHREWAPDWDYGVSVLMGIATYFSADVTVKRILDGEWRKLPLSTFWTWLAVDGVYVVYWFFVDREVLLAARAHQWPLSLSMYLMSGAIWLFPSLEQFPDIPALFGRKKGK